MVNLAKALSKNDDKYNMKIKNRRLTDYGMD